LVTISNEVKRELIYLSILIILEIIIFRIIFNKESFSVILKLAFSLFWLFMLPGFMIMYLFIEKLNFLERIIAGTALGMAFFGVVGYNLGVLGILIKYQNWILPIVGIIIGITALIKNKKITI
jgi:hypothetical protein